MTDAPIALRIPQDLLDDLDALVPERHASRSAAIRRALELYLYQVASERDAEAYDRQPLTEAELAVGSEPENWAATPEW